MLRTLYKHIGKYKLSTLLTILCVIAEAVADVLLPYTMSLIVDNGISKGNMNNVLLYGGAMAFMALIALLFGFLAGNFSANAACGFAANIREALYKSVQNFSFRNIDKYSTSGLITRLTTDVTNLQNAYQMTIRMCIRSPFTLIFSLYMAYMISPKMSVIFFAAAIILVLALSLIIRFATKAFSLVFSKYDALNASVQENITGIRVVKSFVREENETTKFRNAADNLYHLFVRAEKAVVLNFPIMMAVTYGCIVAIFWRGAYLVSSGELTAGNIAGLLAYTASILMSLMILSMVFVQITMSIASMRRISEVLNEEPTIKEKDSPVTEVADGSIELENVSFSYGVPLKLVDWDDPEEVQREKQRIKALKKGKSAPEKDNENARNVLTNISIHIDSGETIGIIGGTGSSKTSLVSLLPRLYDVTEGSIKIGGHNVKDYKLKTLRDSISIVLQKNTLFSGSIKDNLRWGDENASDEECIKACKMACADEFIQNMPKKYDTWIEQGGANLSGGQRQRLCIARALMKKPKVLILDDSTSAVDTATDAGIRKMFREEIPSITKIIISQRISGIKDSDRILVLDDGRISGFDTHENLLKTNEIYRSIAEAQSEGNGDFDEREGS